MNNIEWAALIGGILSGFRYLNKRPTRMKAFRVCITGYFLARYVGEDVINFIEMYFNFTMSKGGALFVIAFLGAEVLERLILIIRSVTLRKLWYKSND